MVRVGIFFGGLSREREVSFVGGRTVYDHLDRNKFEPIPIFVDSVGQFILLNWQHIYQGTIREFYPMVTSIFDIPVYIESLGLLTTKEKERYICTIGKKLSPEDFSQYFDVAFLCLHGPYGEDGSIQGLLAWYGIPYCGSGILSSSLSLDKVFQKALLRNAGFFVPEFLTLSLPRWISCNKAEFFQKVVASIGLPFVVKSSKQGSSIGVTVVDQEDIDGFIRAVEAAFFMHTLCYDVWQHYSQEDKKLWLIRLTDIREGIGFPLYAGDRLIHMPDELLDHIESHFKKDKSSMLLQSTQAEEEVLIEAFIPGREFSCIVLETAMGHPVALPPTEIVKKDRSFSYRAKYLPGMVCKQTPMDLDAPLLDAICQEVLAVYRLLHCKVYARLDGFFKDDCTIIINDPNTTSGMHLSSFLFHQAAEIGLTPTELLTFIISESLKGYRSGL